MKVLKKFTSALCLTLCMVLAIGGTSASAATWRKVTINDSSQYKKAWEKTITYYVTNDAGKKVKIGTMTYGFDTTLTDEDYVWTKSEEGYTLAEIQRITVDSELQYGTKKGMGKYSKIEVSHKNFNIMYQIKFFSTYSGVTESTPVESNVK